VKKRDYAREGCRNCGTQRYPEKRNGYCRRCAYKADKFRRLKTGTWVKRGHYSNLTEDTRLLCIWQTERELATLRDLEEPLSQTTIDPQYIAELLFSIANSARAKPDGWANLGTSFFNCVPANRNPDVYHFLYGVLLEVVESLPHREYRKLSSTLWFWRNHITGYDYEAFSEWRRRMFASTRTGATPSTP